MCICAQTNKQNRKENYYTLLFPCHVDVASIYNYHLLLPLVYFYDLQQVAQLILVLYLAQTHTSTLKVLGNLSYCQIGFLLFLILIGGHGNTGRCPRAFFTTHIYFLSSIVG